jgi:predicted DNA binding CopG/RHH family protein
MSSEYSEPAIGERVKSIMKNKINYTEGEIGEIEIVKDFLPSPAELARRESNVRVTINLRRSSVNFFKNVARKNKVQYQRVIRSLLDTYAISYTNTKSRTRV